MAARAFRVEQMGLAAVSIPAEICPATRLDAVIDLCWMHEPSGEPASLDKTGSRFGAIGAVVTVKDANLSKADNVLLDVEEITVLPLECRSARRGSV